MSAESISQEDVSRLLCRPFPHPLGDLKPKIVRYFIEWYPKNMHIVREFYRLALFLKRNGKRVNYSSQMICHQIRWESMMQDLFDKEYKINQNIGSALGRIVMAHNAELEGMFRTKKHKVVRVPIDENFYAGMSHEDALEMGDPQDLIDY